jgi:hypothetical protein
VAPISTRYAFFVLAIILLCNAWGFAERNGNQVLDVYVFAHADDWILFMGDDIASDAQKGHSILLIQTTGYGDKCWEKAALSALLVAVDNASTRKPSCSVEKDYGSAQCQFLPVNGHRLFNCQYRNALLYFLKLPSTWDSTNRSDEDAIAKGVEEFGGRNMEQLQRGTTGPDGTLPLSSLDKSARYDSFDDLVSTIRSIVIRHAGPGIRVNINAEDPDPALNGGKHQHHLDHITTGCATAKAFNDMNVTERFYVDYASKEKSVNQCSADEKTKRTLLEEFERVANHRFPEPDFQLWLPRKCTRVVETNAPLRMASDSILLYNEGVGGAAILDPATKCERQYAWRTGWSRLIAAKLLNQEDDQVLVYDGRSQATVADFGKRYLECIPPFTQWQHWDVIAPIGLGSGKTDDLLFYSKNGGGPNKGSAEVRSIPTCAGDVPVMGPYKGWSGDWTAILTGNFKGLSASNVFLYDGGNGNAYIYHMPPRPGENPTLLAAPPAFGENVISVSGDFAGDSHTDVLLYDRRSGKAQLQISDEQGHFTKETFSETFQWAFVVAGRFWPDGHDALAAYDGAGAIHIYVFRKHLLQEVAKFAVRGDWTSAVSLRHHTRSRSDKKGYDFVH